MGYHIWFVRVVDLSLCLNIGVIFFFGYGTTIVVDEMKRRIHRRERECEKACLPFLTTGASLSESS